jgi:hypothetical protein
MVRKILYAAVLISGVLGFSCTKEKRILDVRYAPVLYDLVAPDSVERGATLPAPIFVSVYDPDGLGDIDSVYFDVTKPDGSPGSTGIKLRDDGQFGDSSAGDGTYSVGITSSVDNMPGDYIFRFSASDKQDNPSNHPEAIVTLF